jgi:Domain of unknown function (DUF4157)
MSVVGALGTAFGADLSDVHIHDDAAAHALARSQRARALTIGGDIHFARGRWAPDHADGRRLLAHELAHVLQQRGGQAGATAAPRQPMRQPEPAAIDDRQAVVELVENAEAAQDATSLARLTTALAVAGTNPDEPAQAFVDYAGSVYTLAAVDVDVLTRLAAAAHARVTAPPSIAQRIPAGWRLDELSAAFDLAADRVLSTTEVDWLPDAQLKTSALTRVTMALTPGALRISFTPPLMLDAPAIVAANVQLRSVTHDFKTATTTADAQTDSTGFADRSAELEAGLAETLGYVIVATPVAQAGYSPFDDRDIAGTLAALKGNVEHMLVSADASSADADAAGLADVDDLVGGARFTTTKDIEPKAGGPGLRIPKGTRFFVQAYSMAGAGTVNPAALYTLRKIVVTSGPMSIVNGDEVVATIDGATLSAGGAVNVHGLKLQGKAGVMELFEFGARAFGSAAQLAQGGVPSDIALGLGAQQASGQATEALVRQRVEAAFSQAAQQAVLDNDGIVPGMSLAVALGISRGGRPK